MREAKPGGFQTGGFPTFFRERSRLCRGPFRDCSSLVLLIGREREKGRIGKIPAESPDKSGKSRKEQKRTKKEGQVQIGKPPCLKPPRLAALEIKVKPIPQKYFFAFAFVLILIGQMVFCIHVHIDTSPQILLLLSLS